MLKLTVLFLGMGFIAYSTERDALPLNKRTAPAATIDPTDSGLLLKGRAGDSTAPLPNSAAKAAEELGPKPYVASVDTYGSARVSEVALRETLGKQLDEWIAKGLAGDPAAPELEQKLADKIKSRYGFAFAEWSVVQYFEPNDFAVHLTLDVVEKTDVARRMPFSASPTGEVTDPGGLIKLWTEYEDVALELVEMGDLQPETESCVAYHCPFGHKHPKLKKYERLFVEGVQKYEKNLIEVKRTDKRPGHRAAACFLLAYMKEGQKLVTLMGESIRDPDAHVRNNALRVLGDVAEFHPSLNIPLPPVLEALEYPRVSDRSKAIYVVHLAALNSPEARTAIVTSSVPRLIDMIGSRQPDHRELAHAVLRKISGKEYLPSDLASWKAWYNKMPKATRP